MTAICWLTPVKSLEPLILGAERLPLPAEGALEAFRSVLSKKYGPWILPMVKGAILAADSDEEGASGLGACGSGDGPLLSQPGEITFDSRPYSLSECGQAFIDRLPSAEKQKLAFGEMLEEALQDWTGLEKDWLMQIHDWASDGLVVMLVKEE